ncbi:MAG: hypothetical protein Q4D61_06740 [Cardiobacteriaceae bacterium]|nr:hypothetical protein [Cardiobacteriaceae bacterium]
MADTLPLSPLQQLQRLLGLPTWRLRRDIAAEAAKPCAPAAAVDMPDHPAPVPAAPVAAKAAADETPALPVVYPVAEHTLHLFADLTLLTLKDHGTWWLPPVSHGDGHMRLFRSDAEMAMLHALLASVGLTALIAPLADIDAFLATRPMPPRRVSARGADLLSLPAPWLLCGALAQKQAATLAADKPALPLPHPLLLLKDPRQKRLAWQQILAYQQKLHD